jgi:hypothetical protein
MKLTMLLIVLFVGSVGVVFALFAISDQWKDKRGSFLREFPPHPVEPAGTFDMGYNSYYIAGCSANTLYIGNFQFPLHLVQMDLATLDTQHVKLNVAGALEQKFWAARVQVDSPYFYLTDGAVPVIFRGDVSSWKASRSTFDSAYFREIVSINPGSFIIKSARGADHENILGKTMAWKPYREFRKDILEKQLDGVFCTDGMLVRNRSRDLLIYLYYYRNEFILMDTALNVVYKGHTIDTNSRVKIQVADLNQGNSHVLSSPPHFVNLGGSADGNWFFINSNELANNEKRTALKDASVFDVYDLEKREYRFSFYIYHFEGSNRVTEFRAFGDRLVIRQGSLIQVFDLTTQLFERTWK